MGLLRKHYPCVNPFCQTPDPNVTAPGSGSFESTYDIRDSNNANEIMLWENWRGSLVPISATYNSSGQPVPAAANVNGNDGYKSHFQLDQELLPTDRYTIKF